MGKERRQGEEKDFVNSPAAEQPPTAHEVSQVSMNCMDYSTPNRAAKLSETGPEQTPLELHNPDSVLLQCDWQIWRDGKRMMFFALF